MAKKQGFLAEIASSLVGQAISGVFATIREELSELFGDIKDETLALQKRITKRLFSSMLLFIGVLFLITAAILGLLQLRFTPALAFTLIGTLLLIIGGVLQYIQYLQR